MSLLVSVFSLPTNGQHMHLEELCTCEHGLGGAAGPCQTGIPAVATKSSVSCCAAGASRRHDRSKLTSAFCVQAQLRSAGLAVPKAADKRELVDALLASRPSSDATCSICCEDYGAGAPPERCIAGATLVLSSRCWIGRLLRATRLHRVAPR